MRRIALIVNPYSSGVTLAGVERVKAVLERSGVVDVQPTKASGHATELAATAARDHDAVVVFSGDGTYNEAINADVDGTPFGFVPGGGASVFPRGLGMPRDPVASAIRIADALNADRARTVDLGRVNGRRFCFSAGIGFDAETVRRVDSRGRTADGRRASNLVFAGTIVRLLAARKLQLDPILSVDGYGDAAFLFVATGRPYTYAGPVALHLVRGTPETSGLSFVAAREVRPFEVPSLLMHMARGTPHRDARLLSAQGLDRLEAHSEEPLPLHVDGEDLGDVTHAVFEAEHAVLNVLV